MLTEFLPFLPRRNAPSLMMKPTSTASSAKPENEDESAQGSEQWGGNSPYRPSLGRISLARDGSR